MFVEESTQLVDEPHPALRDVTSTARLFNFRRPVYLSAEVWEDCVNMQLGGAADYDELAILQRLRHVLFMAASALHGRIEDLEYDFRVYRVACDAKQGQRQPEAISLRLSAHKDQHNRPVITINLPSK